MTLRKRVKRTPTIEPAALKQEEEDKGEFELGLQTNAILGASFVRYEILEKKGQKILVPVRYSIRNQNLDVSFHAKEALQAVYQPNEMESLFSMDETA